MRSTVPSVCWRVSFIWVRINGSEDCKLTKVSDDISFLGIGSPLSIPDVVVLVDVEAKEVIPLGGEC